METGEAMEEALDGNGWDAVVVDFSMPRFTLGEAQEIVRKKGLDIPFLIVSATILEEDAILAMRQGAHDFIMKDRLARLAPALQHALDRAADRKRQ